MLGQFDQQKQLSYLKLDTNTDPFTTTLTLTAKYYPCVHIVYFYNNMYDNRKCYIIAVVYFQYTIGIICDKLGGVISCDTPACQFYKLCDSNSLRYNFFHSSHTTQGLTLRSIFKSDWELSSISKEICLK